jgi:hypothetical protein
MSRYVLILQISPSLPVPSKAAPKAAAAAHMTHHSGQHCGVAATNKVNQPYG